MLSLIDSHVVIEMISFFIYICLSSLSLCTIDSSINHHLSHPHLIVSSLNCPGTLAFEERRLFLRDHLKRPGSSIWGGLPNYKGKAAGGSLKPSDGVGSGERGAKS